MSQLPEETQRTFKEQVDEILEKFKKECKLDLADIPVGLIHLMIKNLGKAEYDKRIRHYLQPLESIVRYGKETTGNITEDEIIAIQKTLCKHHTLKFRHSTAGPKTLKVNDDNDELRGKQIFYLTQNDYDQTEQEVKSRISLTVRPKDKKEFQKLLELLLEFGESFKTKAGIKTVKRFKIISTKPTTFYSRKDPIILYLQADNISDIDVEAKRLSKIVSGYDCMYRPYFSKNLYPGVYYMANPIGYSVSFVILHGLLTAVHEKNNPKYKKLTFYERMEQIFIESDFTCEDGFFENLINL